MIRCESLDSRYKVRFDNGAHTAECDATPDKGGQGDGFRPHELLEAALGSCTAMVLRMYADAHGIPLEAAEVQVNLDRDTPGQAVFRCAITLRGELTTEQREHLLRAAKACPVRQTLGRAIRVEEA